MKLASADDIQRVCDESCSGDDLTYERVADTAALCLEAIEVLREITSSAYTDLEMLDVARDLLARVEAPQKGLD